MTVGNNFTLEDIGDAELTILVQQYHHSSSGYSETTRHTFEAFPCTAKEARDLIEKFTRKGTKFQVVRPISTKVEINITFDEDV